MKQVTIKDIARELEISVSTVSRALRGHPDISEATKKRVMAAAEEMDYSPNTLAQSLQTQSTRTIGIIVPEIRHHFFSSAISGIEEVAQAAGYTIMVCQSSEMSEREAQNTRALLDHRVAGILASISQTTENVEHFQRAIDRNVPLVFFDRVPDGLETSSVTVDDHGGAFSAVEFLISQGYRRIAHLAGNKSMNIGRERVRGYREALEKHGVPFRSEYVVGCGFKESDGENGVKELLALPEPPDAIFAVNDPVAIGAYKVLRAKGVKIPDEIALVGFTDNPVASLIEPSLTTVAQPAFEIGRIAAELLMHRIKYEQDKEPVHKVLKTQLVVRDSVKPRTS